MNQQQAESVKDLAKENTVSEKQEIIVGSVGGIVLGLAIYGLVRHFCGFPWWQIWKLLP